LLDSVEEMRKHISFHAREGDTFEIAFEGSTPNEAKEVTRLLGECIVQEAITRRTEHAKTLKEFLSAEADRNNEDLRNKEAELAKFSALHPALAARLQAAPGTQQPGGAASGPTPGRAPPTPTDPMLAILESRAFRIERQLAKVAGAPAPPPPPVARQAPFQPPPDSSDLVSARADYAEKSARFTDKHPDVIAARGRLRAAEEAHAATVAAAQRAHAASQPGQAAVPDDPAPKNAADEAALRKELTDLHNQINARRAALAADSARKPGSSAPVADPGGADGVVLEVEFRRLLRDVNEGRERQHQLDDKLFKASMTASSVMNDRNIQVSVLDPAFLPNRPISKSRALMLAVLLGVALLLGIATALLSTRLDDRIYDRLDLERLDILPVLGVIPRELPGTE
jgi:hypothetical protein